MPVAASAVPKLWRVIRFIVLESSASLKARESPAAMVVSAGKLWMANVVTAPVRASRAGRSSNAPQPRADADEPQLAAVGVEAEFWLYALPSTALTTRASVGTVTTPARTMVKPSSGELTSRM